ncbi:MAG: endonuclease/exonuclease/phosphatase family protein [Deltaproteobacteria bacterium]|nr:endonuclease/exonuclease/phosphatase family protein [Deltaproteobacteria bacterium]
MRVLTLNLWQEQGPWAERLDLVAERLPSLDADVICLQEVRHVPGRVPNQAETLAAKLGYACAFEPAQPWGGGDEGLAILSRHPIVERRCCDLPRPPHRERRICLGAAIACPEALTWVFTTHLTFRLEDGAIREQQVRAVDTFVRSRGDAAQTVAVLAGDFNATPEADEMRYLRGLTSIEGERTYYQDAFALCNPGVEKATWAKENPYTAQLGWLAPGRRLDYVFVTPERANGAGRILGSQVVLDAPDARGVWCSDHYGVLADLQVNPSRT